MTDLDRVTAELEALHAFLVDWFAGDVPNEDVIFAAGVVDRLDAELVIVQPGGETFTRDGIAAGVRSAYGRSEGFRIAIRNVQLLRRVGDLLVVLYEEWQVNARNSKPPNNARVSTALFHDDGTRLRWLHVHETWLPKARMAAGPYDF